MKRGTEGEQNAGEEEAEEEEPDESLENRIEEARPILERLDELRREAKDGR